MTIRLEQSGAPRLAGDTFVVALLPVACGFAVVSPQGLTWLPLLIGVAMAVAWRTHLITRQPWRQLADASLFIAVLALFGLWSIIRSFTAADPSMAFAASVPFLFSLTLIVVSFPLTAGVSTDGRWHWGFFPIVNVILALVTALAANGMINLTPLGGSRLGELWHFNRAALLSALLLPVSLFAIGAMRLGTYQSRAFHGLTVIMVGLGVFGSYSESAQLAFAVILVVYGLALVLGSLLPRLVAWGLAAGLLALPFVFVSLFEWLHATGLWDAKPLTVKPRLLMWRAMVDSIRDAPLIGHGVEFVRAMGYRDPETGILTVQTHPHSFLFQIWVDIGFVGVALLIGTIMLLAEMIRRVEGPARVMYAAIMAGGLVIWSVSHGMWQSWFVGLLGISIIYAGIAHHRNGQR